MISNIRACTSSCLCIIAIATLLMPATTFAIQTQANSQPTIAKAQLDSMSRTIERLEQRLSLYEESLEITRQTNQQLSLWWNPYGLLISILGILFAILAIAATLIIFRQGREYRSMIADSINKYQTILNKFIDEKKSELDINIRNTQKKMARASSKQKKEIQKKLNELQQSKTFIESRYASPQGVSYVLPEGLPIYGGSNQASVIMNSRDVPRTCTACGKSFVATQLPPTLFPSSGSITIMNCPHCGSQQSF